MADLNKEAETSTRFEDESRSSREKIDEREGTILFMDDNDEALEDEIGAQLSAFNLVKRKLQDEIELEEKTIKHLEEEKSELSVQVQKLEKEVQDKDAKISDLSPSVESLGSEVTKLKDHIRDLEEKITTQAHDNDMLRQEVFTLRGTQDDGSKKSEEDKDGELVGIQTDVEGQGEDNDEYAIITGLESHINLIKEKDVVEEKIVELEKKLHDRGGVQLIRILIREIHNLLGEEIKRLTEDKEDLQVGILKLEESVKERDNLIVDLQEKLSVRENETTSTLSTLTRQIGSLNEELHGERVKSTSRVDQLESQNAELSDKNKTQQETIKKLQEDSRLIKGRFIQAADRKMQEVIAEFRKTFEDNLRILGRRIRVAEQLQAENREGYKKMKELCEQQHPWVGDQKRHMERCFIDATEMMNKMEKTVVNNIERKEDELLKRLTKVSGELKVSNEWVKFMMNEIRPLWTNAPSSPFCFNDKDEQDKMLREKLRKLEAKVSKEKGVKLRLMKGMYDLQVKVGELEGVIVEKEQEMSKLGEEKVEAIRQLCIWIDYHQDRYQEMMLSTRKNKGRGRRLKLTFGTH